MKNVSIIAQLRVKKPTDPEGTIIIRGYYDRKPIAAISTGTRIRVDHWDHVTRHAIHGAPNASLINMLVDKKLQDIQAVLLKKQIMGATVTTEIIRDAIRGHSIGLNFLEFCKQRIESDYRKRETKRQMKAQYSKLKQFKDDITFADIDLSFLNAYKKFLTDRGNGNNTIWTSFKFLRTMINKAINQKGILTENPFHSFNMMTYEQPHREGLTIENCISIEKLISNPTVQPEIKSVAVRFLLMVYSGMRFTDAMNFDPAIHLQNDRLIMKYSKWDEQVNFKMYDSLERITGMIPAYPLKISNTDFNRWLKLIAVMCNIKIRLTSHVGRHTMGYLLADNNIPKEKAQKILGHRDMRSTDIYYHVTDDQVDRELEKLNNKGPR